MDSTKEMVNQQSEVPHIPEDLIFEQILPRLPVKPLGQFMIAKKSWYAGIRSSHFARKQFDFSVSANKDDASRDCLLHTCFCSEDQINCGKIYADGPNGYEKFSDVKFPKVVGEDENGFIVVGSSDGLVCLTHDYVHSYGRKIYFWNPLIGKFRANVHSTCDDLYSRSSWVGLGFWYDPEENDHKLVRLVYVHNSETGRYFSHCHIEVYSFRTDSWREIGNGVANPFITSCTGGVLMNGSMYWVATHARDDGMVTMFLCFNVKNEEFRTIAWPDLFPLLRNCTASFAVFINIWLCYMRSTNGEIYRALIEIYEQSAWERNFKVVIQEGINDILGITRNAGIVLNTNDMRMVEYDACSPSVKNIAISEYEYFSQMSTYRESLLLLDEETDHSAELDGHMAKEDELKTKKIKDPSEQENINNS